jgi:diaminopimelate epimerase
MKLRIPFVKMHGAGNDFIMVDHREMEGVELDASRIAFLCDRRKGVGADGLIIIEPGSSEVASFRMSYFNADGGEAEMCGNGARCSVGFAHDCDLIGERCTFDTQAGLLEGVWYGPEDVEVALTPWQDLATDIDVGETPWPAHHFVNTGVPHLVIPVDDIDSVPVMEWGSRLRHHPLFGPQGTNVNWVTRDQKSGLYLMRTYERGVEDETLACGTGACAVSVVMCHLGLARTPVALRTRGHDLLTVSIDTENVSLRLRGPAVTSFHGEVWIDD